MFALVISLTGRAIIVTTLAVCTRTGPICQLIPSIIRDIKALI